MTRFRRTYVALSALALAASSLAVLGGSGASAAPFGYAQLSAVQKRHVSGLLATELGGPTANAHAVAPSTARPATAAACTNHYGTNVKVNQNCLNVTDADLQGRAQAQNETWMAADPRNAKHLVASYNDYRRGDGTCGVSYSFDGGTSWADSTTPHGVTPGTPFRGLPRPDWQASGGTPAA